MIRYFAVVLVLGLMGGCGPVGVEDTGALEEEQGPMPEDCDPEDDACWQNPDDDTQDDDGDEDGNEDDNDETDDDTDADTDTDTDPDDFDPAIESCFPDDSIEDLLARFGEDQAMPVNHPSHLMGAWGDVVYRLDSDLDMQGIANTSFDLNGGVMGTVVIYGHGHTIKNYSDTRGMFQAANLILIDVNFSNLQINKIASDIYSDDAGALANFCVCLAMRNVSASGIQVFLPGGYEDHDVRSVGGIAGRVNRIHLDNVELQDIQVRLGSHNDRGFAGAVVGDLGNGGLVRDVRLSGFQVSVDQSFSRTFVGGLFGVVGGGDANNPACAVRMQNVNLDNGTVTNPGEPDGAYNLVGGVVGTFSSMATAENVSVQNVDLVFTPAAMLFAGNMAGAAHLTRLDTQDVTLQVTGNGQTGLPTVGFDNDGL